MKVTCFALLALPALAVAIAGGSAANGDKTITKVVKLLQDMMKKSKEEGETERNLYAKFKCYCDTNDAEKKDSIATYTKTIGLLESAIDSLQSSNGDLSAETAQLKTSMAENKAARDEAKTVRDKAAKAFAAEEKDLDAAIGQMDEAVKVLAAIGADQTLGAGADHEKFMAGKKVKSPLLVSLDAQVKTALSAASIFLTNTQQQQMNSFLQAPFTGTYSSQSGQIVGILKDMRKTFATNLETARATEKKEKAAFGEFMKTKEEAFKSMEATFKDKQETLSSNDEALTSKKKQFQTAQKDKADAEEFLEKLTDMCAKKAEEHDARKLERANEQAAVAQAIAILNSDSAFETFGSVDATSSGKTKAASFLQLGQRSSDQSLRRQLEEALRVAKSTRLARVLATVEAGNPFEKVLLEIKKMVTLNEEEGKEDKKNLDWCNAERKENKDNLKDRKAEIVTLTGDIDQLGTTIDDPVKGLKQQIKETETSLVQNDQAQKDETKQRTTENVAYQADVRNLVEAEDLLDKAVTILSKYYEGLAKRIADQDSLVQEDPAPPKTWDTYEGQNKKNEAGGNDAVSMLKYILSETKAEEKKAHEDEEKGQASYEDSMQALKDEQAKSEKSLVKLQEDLAAAEKSLIEKTEDLKDTEAAKAKIENYLLQIKPGCDFITTNFDLREKNRKTETDALNKAVKLIKATPAYKTAMAEAKVKGFGKCAKPCKADEAGAKCKACMAGVTVPAYCAGHSGTKGC